MDVVLFLPRVVLSFLSKSAPEWNTEFSVCQMHSLSFCSRVNHASVVVLNNRRQSDHRSNRHALTVHIEAYGWLFKNILARPPFVCVLWSDVWECELYRLEIQCDCIGKRNPDFSPGLCFDHLSVFTIAVQWLLKSVKYSEIICMSVWIIQKYNDVLSC